MSDALDALTTAGIEAVAADSFGPATIDVPAADWVAAHEVLRDGVGFTFFDFLSASDELTDGFRIVTHLADFWGGAHVDHVLVRTLIPRATPQLATLSDLYAGANWHERETHEMFGITFDGHPNLVPLLLPDGFEGNPLRKEFILAARVAKPWPGAKEPGESDHAPTSGAPSRRRTLPPGVPDPDSWGPRPPGTPDPDPLAPAQAAATPARRTPPNRRTKKQTTPDAATPANATAPADAPAPTDATPPTDAAPPDASSPGSA
ncbi:NADH-quinone oxidoreductase subunit C [Kribbella sp. NPDC056345]|uniref:NADH-quinone oxidoreductase subunit C n=1 Tax=Kribbella sp. NPDC056345 TaxID=3345789 RepID=UPI0035E1AFAA